MKHPRTLLAGILAPILLAAAAAGAQGITVSFDDLAPLAPVPAAYGGICWETGRLGFCGHDGEAFAADRVAGGHPKSGAICLANGWGVRQIGITFSAGRVDLVGAFIAVYGDPCQWASGVAFEGFRSGESVYRSAVLIPGTRAVYLPAAFHDVDRVVIHAAQGTNGSGGWYSMDDLQYIPVPEPGGWLALAAAASGALGVRRRAEQRRPLRQAQGDGVAETMSKF